MRSVVTVANSSTMGVVHEQKGASAWFQKLSHARQAHTKRTAQTRSQRRLLAHAKRLRNIPRAICIHGQRRAEGEQHGLEKAAAERGRGNGGDGAACQLPRACARGVTGGALAGLGGEDGDGGVWVTAAVERGRMEHRRDGTLQTAWYCTVFAAQQKTREQGEEARPD